MPSTKGIIPARRQRMRIISQLVSSACRRTQPSSCVRLGTSSKWLRRKSPSIWTKWTARAIMNERRSSPSWTVSVYLISMDVWTAWLWLKRTQPVPKLAASKNIVSILDRSRKIFSISLLLAPKSRLSTKIRWWGTSITTVLLRQAPCPKATFLSITTNRSRHLR